MKAFMVDPGSKRAVEFVAKQPESTKQVLISFFRCTDKKIQKYVDSFENNRQEEKKEK